MRHCFVELTENCKHSDIKIRKKRSLVEPFFLFICRNILSHKSNGHDMFCIAKISQFKTTMDQDISTNILMLGLLVSFSSFNRARKILLKSSLLSLSRMFHLKDVKKNKQLRVKMKNRTKQKKQATQKK